MPIPSAHSIDLSKLSMTKLEKLFAVHSKDERNVVLKQYQCNWDAMDNIMDELIVRLDESEDVYYSSVIAERWFDW